MREIKISLKRILVILMIFITLMFFLVNSVVHSKSKLPSEGEFYYSGVTEGKYTVGTNIFAWLLENLGAIVDWILGMCTMLFRMVFVGWTALIEMLLTWVLESTMNMDMEIDDINATSVSANTDSSQNVTVEAIVLGLVPMFDINIFNLTLADNITGTGIDLSKYKCEECGEGIDKCACTTCDCNLCEVKDYYQTKEDDADGNEIPRKNAVLMVKEAVAKWYYIIRIIAMMAMLIVLIAIGIKMATSTIASEKALVKRMFVDWVVGMIILFTIQFIMVAIINVNDSLVKIIRQIATPTSTSADATIDVSNSPSFNKEQKDNSSVELSLYEEARTRAYDVKFMNGLTGMILYMTLVYMAIRFSLFYIKRYFTIIVLTLMAPGIAVAYALQKVLTGKSASFGTWLKEYILNVIIQPVHAFLYVAFVSLALKLALESVVGMIFAFIIMNYMLKAEKLFRKIFNMSSAAGLLDENENSDPVQSFNKAAGTIAGARAIGNLAKKPIAAAASGGAKLAVLGASLAKKKVDDFKVNRNMKNASEKYRELSKDKKSDEYKQFKKSDEYKNLRQDAIAKLTEIPEKNRALVEEGYSKGGFEKEKEEALRAAIYTDNRPLKEGETEKQRKQESAARWAEYSALNKKDKKYKKLMGLTVTGVVKAHIGQLIDYNNYFNVHENENGDLKINPFTDLPKGYFKADQSTGKFSYVSPTNEMLKYQMSSDVLLGFTEADKKRMKELRKFTTSGFLGMGAMICGLGTVVVNPKIGMGLLAVGVSQTSKFTKRNGKRINRPKQLGFNNSFSEESSDEMSTQLQDRMQSQRFRLARFNSGAMLTMQGQLEKAAEDDRREMDRRMVSSVRTNRPKLSENLENDNVQPTGKIHTKDTEETTFDDIDKDKLHNEEMDTIVRRITYKPPREMILGGVQEQINISSLQHYKQISKLVKKEKKNAVIMISEAVEDEFKQKFEELMKSIEAETQTQSETSVLPEKGGTNEHQQQVTKNPTQKTREDITDVKDIDTILEVAILEAATATKKEVSDMDINKADVQKDIKATIVSILLEKNGMKKDEHIEDIIKNIDTEILKAKERLDKAEKASNQPPLTENASQPVEGEIQTQIAEGRSDSVKTEGQPPIMSNEEKKKSIKDILREAVKSDETAEEFLQRITGFDSDGVEVEEIDIKSQKAAAKEKKKIEKAKLTKSQQDMVIELLLMQKQMSDLNKEAIALKVTPTESNKRYERARTFVYDDSQKKTVQGNNRGDASKYGPVTDIVALINKL